MANTEKLIEAGPAHADKLVIGGLSETVQIGNTGGTMINAAIATASAAGTSQSDATAITAHITHVTTDNAAKGVVLPAAATGRVCIVYNNSAPVLIVYPASGDDINDGSANAPITMGPKSRAEFVAVDSSTWAWNQGLSINYRTGAAGAAVATTGATNSSPYGYSEAQANAIVTLVNELRATLVAAGLMKGAA